MYNQLKHKTKDSNFSKIYNVHPTQFFVSSSIIQQALPSVDQSNYNWPERTSAVKIHLPSTDGDRTILNFITIYAPVLGTSRNLFFQDLQESMDQFIWSKGIADGGTTNPEPEHLIG